MENFFTESDDFFRDIEDYCGFHELEKEIVEKYPDDWQKEVLFTFEEPIEKLCADWIAEKFDDGRFSEDNFHDEYDEVVKVLNENIDFKKINDLLPRMYYPNGKKGLLTKKVLMEYFSENS